MQDDEAEINLRNLHKRWPQAHLQENLQTTLAIVETMFGIKKKSSKPLSLHVSGTNFQTSVWKALLQISPGTVTSYSRVANAIGRPTAARAVGLAVGANPVAFVIPCHRVIQQSGRLGGFRWGETRKHAIHAWEAARY
jgi:AraC family transcriptional regulator of adaptative response/methylated-DNA-[protein]-cysteine methyltransferase